MHRRTRIEHDGLCESHVLECLKVFSKKMCLIVVGDDLRQAAVFPPSPHNRYDIAP